MYGCVFLEGGGRELTLRHKYTALTIYLFMYELKFNVRYDLRFKLRCDVTLKLVYEIALELIYTHMFKLRYQSN